ncbi:Suppressor of fused protein (SUFU) [Hymenobacter amundsenii]|uniref:Suppressor of fused protein (SUFU) n=1 Tax=Hymenobacter amundsenii TaxID=2006685 RepID=A0A246FI48_9BACT|nr:suppressor of fused domain protein [Hymenobacter amundsenii]OWP62207.1 Suppressor of fused protein (SUFU) [Hymenobacter amundsenii]
MKVYEHMEMYLGKIAQGWKPEASTMGIQASMFLDTPHDEVNTYSTLGMSDFKLDIGGKYVRQELIFGANRSVPADGIVSFLTSFAEGVVKSKRGLLRGEVVSGKKLFTGTECTGVYCSNPVFWEDELSSFEFSNPPTVFVWLMPILEKEANYINKKGWSDFEDLLESVECDFWDLNRKSCV